MAKNKGDNLQAIVTVEGVVHRLAIVASSSTIAIAIAKRVVAKNDSY